MRIQSIHIERWRHFEGVNVTLPSSAPIICIVGGNGTGKSQLLELIAACAQHLGLSAGTEGNRANPFQEDSVFDVTLLVSTSTIPLLSDDEFLPKNLKDEYFSWDKTLTVSARPGIGAILSAGGVSSSNTESFSKSVVSTIQQSASIHYLSVDADRAFPKVSVPAHLLPEAFDRDWEATNKLSSFKLTRSLYEEWYRYLLGTESQENNKHIQSIRRAREQNTEEPVFIDKMNSYKLSIQKVLPHLLFVGVDQQKKEIIFDSAGLKLSFYELSGGEREIAFLIGQVERFGLKKGLLLIDEPELHLNFDLLRSWIGFLKDSVEDGQIWFASHSLEVVEVTGQDATFILERDENTRRVKSIRPLNTEPIIATLSRSIGSPAFSMSTLAFIVIEGEEEIGERERFRLLCDVPGHVRFMEGGSCNGVIHRIKTLNEISSVSGHQIRIAGVIDGDWRPANERRDLKSKGLFVLGVHEIENLLLHPETLSELMVTLGRNAGEVEPLLLAAADKRAGVWIFEAARTDRRFRDFPPPSAIVRELIHRTSWVDFTRPDSKAAEIASSHGDLEQSQVADFAKFISAQASIYARKRNLDAVWKVCEGKQVFKAIMPQLGFADAGAGERAIIAIWRRKPELMPAELTDLRAFIDSV